MTPLVQDEGGCGAEPGPGGADLQLLHRHPGPRAGQAEPPGPHQAHGLQVRCEGLLNET